MLQLPTRSDLQNCSFEIVIKQLGAIKKQRLPNESQKTIWESERERERERQKWTPSPKSWKCRPDRERSRRQGDVGSERARPNAAFIHRKSQLNNLSSKQSQFCDFVRQLSRYSSSKFYPTSCIVAFSSRVEVLWLLCHTIFKIVKSRVNSLNAILVITQ